MFQTTELLHDNFKLFDTYFNIFIKIKNLLEPGSTMTQKESLSNAYRLYVYEKPNPKLRGLPEQDEDGNEIPLLETQRGYDTSDEEADESLKLLLKNLKMDEGHDL